VAAASLNACAKARHVSAGTSGPKHRPAAATAVWLIGYGVGSSIRGHYQTTAEARVRLDPDGQVIVQTDMTDIGTGTYTIAAQVAAAALGVPVGQVRVELARSNLPRGNGAGGSWGSGNTSVAIDRACQALREKLGASPARATTICLPKSAGHSPPASKPSAQRAAWTTSPVTRTSRSSPMAPPSPRLALTS